MEKDTFVFETPPATLATAPVAGRFNSSTAYSTESMLRELSFWLGGKDNRCEAVAACGTVTTQFVFSKRADVQAAAAWNIGLTVFVIAVLAISAMVFR